MSFCVRNARYFPTKKTDPKSNLSIFIWSKLSSMANRPFSVNYIYLALKRKSVHFSGLTWYPSNFLPQPHLGQAYLLPTVFTYPGVSGLRLSLDFTAYQHAILSFPLFFCFLSTIAARIALLACWTLPLHSCAKICCRVENKTGEKNCSFQQQTTLMTTNEVLPFLSFTLSLKLLMAKIFIY